MCKGQTGTSLLLTDVTCLSHLILQNQTDRNHPKQNKMTPTAVTWRKKSHMFISSTILSPIRTALHKHLTFLTFMFILKFINGYSCIISNMKTLAFFTSDKHGLSNINYTRVLLSENVVYLGYFTITYNNVNTCSTLISKQVHISEIT